MKKIIGTLIATTLLLGASAFASIKVGIIDLPQILQTSPQVQAINTKLKDQFKPQQEKITELRDKIRSEAEKLAPGKEGKLKADQRKEIQNKIMADQKELQKTVRDFQTAAGKAQEKAMKEFIAEVDTAVKKIAEKDKLELVLLKPAVVYASNTVDVTKQVLDALPKK